MLTILLSLVVLYLIFCTGFLDAVGGVVLLILSLLPFLIFICCRL
jgi:hypothetical protein